MSTDAHYIATTINPAAIATKITELDLDPGPAVTRLAAVWTSMAEAVSEPPATSLIGDLTTVDPTEAAEKLMSASREAVAHDKANEIWVQAQSLLRRTFRQALVEAEPDLIAQARPKFDKAVATLSTIVEKLGSSDPDPSIVLGQGAEAVEAWNARHAANDAVEEAAAIVTILARPGTTVDVASFIESAASADHLEEARKVFKRGGFAGLLEAGTMVPRLNTASEAAALVEAATAATTAANQEAEEERRRPSPREEARQARLVKNWTDVVTKVATK